MNQTKVKVLILTMLLTLALGASACAENALSNIIDAGYDLLFRTGNATVTAEAEFALDGTVFKKFTGTHIQTESGFLRDILLESPGQNGTAIESGYIILQNENGRVSYDRRQQAIDLYSYVSGKSSFLRRSVKMDNFAELCKGIASLAGRTLPQGTVTEEAGTVLITLDAATVPEAGNAALTALLQLFGSGRDWINYLSLTPDAEACVEDYNTVTCGILFCTTSVCLQKLDAVVVYDDNGRLSDISGAIRVQLNQRNATARELTVIFHASAADYGTSVLAENPLPTASLSYSAKINLMLYLTEVYGYTQWEADDFVYTYDGSHMVCYQPEHPERKYRMIDDVLYTPYETTYENYPGEGGLRGFLYFARMNDWLNQPTAQSQFAIQTWLTNFNIIPNEALTACLQYGSTFTADQFIRELFISCYGPEETWSEPVTAWRDEELAQWMECEPNLAEDEQSGLPQ